MKDATAKPKKRPGRVSSRKKHNFVVSTRSEVAEFFKVSLAAVNKWAQEADPMPGTSGKYDLSEIVFWRHQRLSGKSGNDAVDTKKRVELDLAQLELDRKRFDFDKERVLYLAVKDVVNWLSEAFVIFREDVLSWPDAIAASTPDEIKSETYKGVLRGCRNGLSVLRQRLLKIKVGDGVVNVMPSGSDRLTGTAGIDSDDRVASREHPNTEGA